ncbi:MAG: hypothetical protein JWM85_2253 [Acidimicrobiaceae bacterium]|nr:hypothetical protein [Acidimicrobiaceae bacterium]
MSEHLQSGTADERNGDGLPADAGSEQAPVGGSVAPVQGTAPGGHATTKVPVTRAGRAWVGVVIGVIVLALLLVFIFQNLHSTRVHFFTASGSVSVALALLLSAIAGALVVLLIGSVRILQLRRGVRAGRGAARIAEAARAAEHRERTRG